MFKMLRMKALFGFIMAAIVFACASVSAHEIRPTIFELNFAEDRSFTLKANANLEAILAGIGPEHDDTDDSPNAARYNALRLLPPAELAAAYEAQAAQWLAGIGLSFDGAPAKLELSVIGTPEVGDPELARLSDITMKGVAPEGVENLRWNYAEKYGASILRINRPGEEQFAQFYNAGATSEPMKITNAEERTFWGTVSYYVYQGFLHIIPAGLDHILFVLGLFLLSTRLKPLLWQVTAFTLAHTITLALAGSGVISLNSQFVESLIALSIVYVAVENIFTQKLHAWRPVIVFLFGLLHGLGFAGVMAEVGLPDDYFWVGLLSFNVGVEIGQLAVILIAFAVVGWFIRKPWYRRVIVIPASLVIAVIGAYWFVERAMGWG